MPSKLSIVTAKKPRRTAPVGGAPLASKVVTHRPGQSKPQPPEDPEAEARVRAFFARMLQPPGPRHDG